MALQKEHISDEMLKKPSIDGLLAEIIGIRNNIIIIENEFFKKLPEKPVRIYDAEGKYRLDIDVLDLRSLAAKYSPVSPEATTMESLKMLYSVLLYPKFRISYNTSCSQMLYKIGELSSMIKSELATEYLSINLIKSVVSKQDLGIHIIPSGKYAINPSLPGSKSNKTLQEFIKKCTDNISKYSVKLYQSFGYEEAAHYFRFFDLENKESFKDIEEGFNQIYPLLSEVIKCTTDLYDKYLNVNQEPKTNRNFKILLQTIFKKRLLDKQIRGQDKSTIVNISEKIDYDPNSMKIEIPKGCEEQFSALNTSITSFDEMLKKLQYNKLSGIIEAILLYKLKEHIGPAIHKQMIYQEHDEKALTLHMDKIFETNDDLSHVEKSITPDLIKQIGSIHDIRIFFSRYNIYNCSKIENSNIILKIYPFISALSPQMYYDNKCMHYKYRLNQYYDSLKIITLKHKHYIIIIKNILGLKFEKEIPDSNGEYKKRYFALEYPLPSDHNVRSGKLIPELLNKSYDALEIHSKFLVLLGLKKSMTKIAIDDTDEIFSNFAIEEYPNLDIISTNEKLINGCIKNLFLDIAKSFPKNYIEGFLGFYYGNADLKEKFLNSYTNDLNNHLAIKNKIKNYIEKCKIITSDSTNSISSFLGNSISSNAILEIFIHRYIHEELKQDQLITGIFGLNKCFNYTKEVEKAKQNVIEFSM